MKKIIFLAYYPHRIGKILQTAFHLLARAQNVVHAFIVEIFYSLAMVPFNLLIAE
jgi:hypothetical protein